MFHQTELRDLLPGLVPFPTDVFDAEQPWLADHLLPLISIDLNILNPELAGTVVHMLCPIEPFEGYIGDGTEAHHNAFTAPNWFAFRLTDDNRYRFLGSEAYFQRAPEHGDAFTRNSDTEARTAEMFESYARARAYFEANGRLASHSRYGKGKPIEHAYLDRLGGGGEFEYGGNWANGPDVPPAFRFALDDIDQGNAAGEGSAISLNGKPLLSVAEVAGYNWCAAGADSILLFYEPESRTALFTFDWS